ncbi:MAG: hypothetical protein U5K29_12075 [Acidimicrobiales bacterium]|nr:hypothetical protein [Acidimicrobiales bacterium]
MRYERLVIDAGQDQTFALDFHPRLTVITGVGRAERDGLMSELVGTLSDNRAGGHLEVTDDRGRHLAVFRPHGARHLVVDIDAGTDVSAAYRTPEGSIDLLAVEGLDQQTAKRRMRVTAQDLTTRTQSAELIRRLAACDQALIWKIAERLQSTEATLHKMAEDAGTAPEDLELVDSVERRHQEYEAAQARHERVRKLTFYLAAASAMAALPLGYLITPVAALGALVPAVLILATSLLFWRKLTNARKAEEDALERAGASSYLGFHLQRVNSLLSSDQSRRELSEAAEAHRDAVDAWQKQAGDVPVAWALDHREDIVSAARVRVRAENPASEIEVEDLGSVLAEELVVRLAEARRIGQTGESFPLVLDDPFVNFDSSVKPALLELLVESSHRQQVLLLTEDPDVAAWARLEAITGALSVVEPSAAEATTEAESEAEAEAGKPLPESSRIVI